jgi:hypothetical protein
VHQTVTTVVISQPMLFPWPGFFEMIALADVYVHLDDAQFSKGSFTNRIQIKYPNGMKWMTVPLARGGTFQKISDLEAAGDGWKAQHRMLVVEALRGAPYLNTALGLIDDVYAQDSLLEILCASIEKCTGALGLPKPLRWERASSLGLAGASWQRVLAMVTALGGTRYVTAHGAMNYLDHEAFERAGVGVEYVAYSKTPYAQQHGLFTPYVSILDLIANEGPAARLKLRPETIPWRDMKPT